MTFQTVLVVDDEPHIIEIVHDYLKQAGFRVLTARDGQTGLTIARHERPDLVILDLMLPGGAGWTGRLPQHPPGPHPVRRTHHYADGPH